MAATITTIRTIDTAPSTVIEETEVSEGMRITRYCSLEELPGLVFGIMTVAYIVLSLTRLFP